MTDPECCPACGSPLRTAGSEGFCPRCLLESASAEEPSWLSTGESFGRYRILRFLNRGGMGEVYEARDTSLDRPVALKFLPLEAWEEAEKRQALQQEARLAASINHPGICTIFEVAEWEGIPYVAMEMVEGRPLDAVEPSWERLLPIFLQLLDGLGAAHQRGVVHRDLKPSNILVQPDGRPKILDFGLAKSTQPGQALYGDAPTAPGRRLAGTIPYMSPEQVRGEPADRRSDLFSVGIILYELLSGSSPFEGEGLMERAAALLKDSPRPLGATSFPVPPGIQPILEKALAREPDRRFQSAAEFSDALNRLPAPGLARPAPGHLLWISLAGIVLLLLALWIGRGWRSREGSDGEIPQSRAAVLTEQARPLALGFSVANNRLAIDLLEESISLEADSADAHSLLALARLKRFWWYRTETSLLSEALEASRQALLLDPNSAGARAVNAIARSLAGPAPAPYLELAECLQEEAGQPEALVWLAYGFYAPAGLFEEALELAGRLDPAGPYRLMVEAYIRVQQNDLGRALPIIQQVQLALPDSDAAPHLQGRAAIQAGNLAMLDAAIRMYDLLAPDKITARVFQTYATAARTGQAPSLPAAQEEAIRLDRGMSILMAQTWARMGETESALQWLRHALDDGSFDRIALAHPDFDILRSTPEFQRLRSDLERRIRDLAAELRPRLRF